MEENKSFNNIENKSKGIDHDLFKKYFDFKTATHLTKKLFKIKDKRKNNAFVKEINNRWSKLKDEIEGMTDEDDKKEIDQLDEILKIVE